MTFFLRASPDDGHTPAHIEDGTQAKTAISDNADLDCQTKPTGQEATDVRLDMAILTLQTSRSPKVRRAAFELIEQLAKLKRLRSAP